MEKPQWRRITYISYLLTILITFYIEPTLAKPETASGEKNDDPPQQFCRKRPAVKRSRKFLDDPVSGFHIYKHFSLFLNEKCSWRNGLSSKYFLDYNLVSDENHKDGKTLFETIAHGKKRLFRFQ